MGKLAVVLLLGILVCRPCSAQTDDYYTTAQTDSTDDYTTTPETNTTDSSGMPGSGTDNVFAVCADIREITLELYDCLYRGFQCNAADGHLLYDIFTLPSATSFVVNEATQPCATPADYFRPGRHMMEVIVCASNGNVNCDGIREERVLYLGALDLVVQAHSGRLFPYGAEYGDNSLINADDVARQVTLQQGFPFFQSYHTAIHLSTNGLASFNQPYLTWWPTPFPYGRTSIPIIAPFWADIDFRNSVPSSGLYYQVYSSESTQLANRNDRLLQDFADRLSRYSSAPSTFSPAWMLVATWRHATPYYGRSNSDETVTFQMVLATDFISSFVLFLYDDFDWNEYQRRFQRVVSGYDARDFRNYHNIEPLLSPSYFNLDSIAGNSGELGAWYFNLTSNEELDFDGLCIQWSQRQSSNVQSELTGLSCPCTSQQAWRDWRFWFGHRWGLSSRPNCATLLFSRRQSTIECCYDNDGSLLIGPQPGAGTYKLFNPLRNYLQYATEDSLPYDYCCEQSDRCSTYYRHRPYDTCESYVNPRPWFIWGDPHFLSVDGRRFTFNGIGEYLLLQSPANSVSLQGRFIQFGDSVNGTVTAAVVIQQGSVQLQVQIESGDLVLYFGQQSHDLPTLDSVLVITDTINTISIADGSASIFSNDDNIDQLFVQSDQNGSITITTSSNLALTVTPQMTFLSFSVELTEQFTDETSGLLGVFNGDTSDDFRTRNDAVLNISTDQEIYDFGLLWHINEGDSNFVYVGEDSYELYNGGYAEFTPTFIDTSQASPDLQTACNGDASCIYDTMVTGSMEVGMSSMNISMSNDDLVVILENRPPIIAGDRVVFATTNTAFIAKYNVTDPDGDNIVTFDFKPPVPNGITLTRDASIVSVQWQSPGIELPSDPVLLVATDSVGASSLTFSISVILCACLNGGVCVDIEALDTLQYNASGHYKQMCDCAEFYGGASCETEMRGCGFAECPDYALCVNDSSMATGYICSNCTDGYSLNTTLDKCTDIDECVSMDSSCTQGCNNTEGSFLCVCDDGYILDEDGFTCQDINECELGTDTCSQLCNNTEGRARGYDCSCVDGYLLTGTSNCVTATCSGGVTDPCDTPAMCGEVDGGVLQCLCGQGLVCEGDCSGSLTQLSTGTQTCNSCDENLYGHECTQTCNCMNNGACDPMDGCVCTEGYRGINCSIEVNAFTPEFNPAPPPTLEIGWDLMAGSTVFAISAVDNDTTPNAGAVTYSLLPAAFQLRDRTSDGFGVFTVSSDGSISLVDDLIDQMPNFSQFVLTVQASDSGEPARTATAVVTLIPRPVPTITVIPSSIEILENLTVGSVVAVVNCSEIGGSDEPSELGLSLSAGQNLSAMFRLSDFSVVLAIAFDFEVLGSPTFSLNLTCSNRYSFAATAVTTVEIINIDDNAFVFNQDAYSVSIPEDTRRGANILNVSAFDPDYPNAEISYSVIGSEDFSVFQDSGVVYVGRELDRESQELYTLQVMAEVEIDGIQQNITAELNITLLDVNDNAPVFRQPYIITLTTRAIIGDLVVTVFANDTDTGANANISYRLEPSDVFVLDERTGQVFVNTTLSPRAAFMLTVYASDGGSPPMNSSTIIDIFVIPSPDRVAFANATVEFSVAEDERRGALIGAVSAIVFDVTNTSLSTEVSYQFTENFTTDIFTINSASGEIFLLTSLDYEMSSTIDFIVMAFVPTDPLIQPGFIIVEIAVQDINDNAPVFIPAFYAEAIEEFSPIGTTIVTVSATDLDSIFNITYTLTGLDSEPFEIGLTSGVIVTVRELDIARDYRFSVVAEDGGTPLLSAETVVYVSVTRSTSVTPTFDRESYVFDISENSMAGSYVGTVVALTQGNRTAVEFSHLSYRILMPDPTSNGSMLFHIDEESGNISTLSETAFDRESRNNFVFYVEVVDGSDSLDNATVQVRITDANDNAPQFSQPLYTRVITSAEPLNSVILNVTATDEDSGSNSDITYSLSSLSLEFSISQTGAVSLIEFPIAAEDYRLTVEARDNGSPQLTGSVLVFIAVIPASPDGIIFTEQEYIFQVREDAPMNGTLVGRVQAIDSGLNISLSDVTYSTGNVTDCFHLDSVEGDLRVACTLNREEEPVFELDVVASVEGVTGHARVVVEVLDVNDNAPSFIYDVYTRVIDDQYGNETAILEFPVEAIDPDSGLNGTVRYALLQSSDADLFTINDTTGDLYLLESSIELGDYRLTVRASDLGEPVRQTATALVLICVTRAGDNTVDFAPMQTFSIAEDAPPGSVVGTVLLDTQTGLINPDEFPDNLRFEIVAGDSLDNFTINSSGVISTVVHLDRESAAQHVIVVDAIFRQFGILVGNASFTISVLDVNDQQPTFVPTAYSAITNDSVDTGFILVSVRVSDFDEGSNAEIAFSIAPGTPFGIRTTTTSYPYTFGELYVVASSMLAVDTYTFMITATDDGSPSLNSSATVSIIIEHSIIEFNNDTYYFAFVEETPVNTVVGTVSVRPRLDSVIYSITGGNDGTYFAINPLTGEILNTRAIDRETVTDFNFTVQAESPGIEPTNSTVVVTILDLNDNPPMFSTSTYTAVYIEDTIAVGDTLVNATATDDDEGTNSQIVYALSNSSDFDQEAFNINTSTGAIYTTQVLRDGAYNLEVLAADMGSPALTSTAVVIITIDAPFPDSISFSQPSGYIIPVSEFTRSGEHVGSVEILPLPDNVVAFVRFVASSAGVAISPTLNTVCPPSTPTNSTGTPTLGCFTARENYDFEEVQSYTFIVTVQLDGIAFGRPSLSSSVEVTVQVVDENDNDPVFIDFPIPPEFPNSRVRQDEEQPNDILIFDINATDADSGSNSLLTYEIINTDLVDKFYINSSTGMLFAVAGLDREEQDRYFITIQVSDNGLPIRSAQGRLEYILLNLNDNLPILTSGLNYSVAERLPPNSVAFVLEGSDADENTVANIRYFLESHQDIFALTNAEPGVLRTLIPLDFEDVATYIVSVLVRDSSIGAVTNNVVYNITVNVLNEPDNVPAFNDSSYGSSVAPVVADGQTVASVFASDADGDTIRYSIVAITQSGNNDVIPALGIEQLTGRIYSLASQTLIPEANFTITVEAFDYSRYNLSVLVSVIVTVLPEQLQFTQELYNADISESSGVGSEVVRVPISALSVSSDISYAITVTDPASTGFTFSSQGNGEAEVTILLASSLDRENIQSYTIDISATRDSSSELATATLVLTITDANDNNPVFTDAPNSMITIDENIPSRTRISKANATDADIDLNGDIRYSFVNPPADLPFIIDRVTGTIETVGTIDYEDEPSYTFTVLARDQGSISLSATNTYTVNIENLNDNFPLFSANAYFGEVYSMAAANDFVRHTLLNVADADDTTANDPLNFNIVFPTNSPQFGEDYFFEVSRQPPFIILVKRLAENADARSQLLELRVEVSDEGGLTSVVPLYISVFTQSNLVQFVFKGVTEAQLLSCTDQRLSICEFRLRLGEIVQQEMNSLDPISFYNESVVTSATDITELTVTLYGWYGTVASRESNGELSSSSRPFPEQYIDFSADLFETVAASTALSFFGFSVELPPEEVTPPGGPDFSIIAGIAAGGVVAVLILILVIVLVVVFGRRRKDKPKKKKRRPSDPYERGYNQLQSRQRRKDGDDHITNGGSDLAYETMYDDDEMAGTQTMPWFDPKYLAHDNDEYHGDTEQTTQRPGGMRATVDGDARRTRRRSSDEGQSVTELDTTGYLQQYQHPTPMQPGQRMGELDMFARPREDDKPFRPSLQDYQWKQRSQQHATSRV